MITSRFTLHGAYLRALLGLVRFPGQSGLVN
jgi:hypothetical protein